MMQVFFWSILIKLILHVIWQGVEKEQIMWKFVKEKNE